MSSKIISELNEHKNLINSLTEIKEIIESIINETLNLNKNFIFTSTEKQFAFLGVYSGEPFRQSTPIEFDDFTIVRKDGFNLGVVWYSYLIPEILNTGRQI